MDKILKAVYKSALATALGATLMYGLPKNSYADGMPNPNPIGAQGTVNNNQNPNGNCSDGFDNDGDTLIDRQDVLDCYENGNYNPKFNEGGNNKKKIPGTPQGGTPEIPSPTQSRKNENPQGKNINSIYGGNLTMFYTPVESTSSYLYDQGSLNTKFKGNLIGGNAYARIPVNGKLRLIVLGEYSNLTGDSSNSASDLNSLVSERYKGKAISQFNISNGNLEAGIAYEDQTTKFKINPYNMNIEEKLNNVQLALRGIYEFSKGNLKYGPIAGAKINFLNIKQEDLDKKATTIEGEAGGFIEGDNIEGILTLNYNQVYDASSDSMLNGTFICPQIQIGNKTYIYAGGEFSITGNSSINKNLYLIGLGQKIGDSFEMRASYFNGTENYNNKITETQTTDNGFIVSIGINTDGGVKSSLSPLKLMPKTR